MPVITLELVVDAPLDRVVAIARDVEAFPQFMPDVKSVNILEQNESGSELKTEWVAVIKQFSRELKWVQRDRWDPEKQRVEFEQIEGDYDRMSGFWEFQSEQTTMTRFVNYIDYEYSVPLLGALLTRVVEYLVRQNLMSAMEAIRAKAENAATGGD